jgi:hypothetical protein
VKTGVQKIPNHSKIWMPAFAGMTIKRHFPTFLETMIIEIKKEKIL